MPPLAPLRSLSSNTVPASEDFFTSTVLVLLSLFGSGSYCSLLTSAVLSVGLVAGIAVQRTGTRMRVRPSSARSPMWQLTVLPFSAQLPVPVVTTSGSVVLPIFCHRMAPAPPRTSSPAGRVSVTTTPSPLTGLVPLRSRDRLWPGPRLSTSSTYQNGWYRLTAAASAGSGCAGSSCGWSITAVLLISRSARMRMVVVSLALLLPTLVSASLDATVTALDSVSPLASGELPYS